MFQRVIAVFFLTGAAVGCVDGEPVEPVGPATVALPASDSSAVAQKPAAKAPASATQSQARVTSKDLWRAEPISALTIQSLPHLTPFQGQLLLGNKTQHVVLASIPTHPRRSPWQPLIISAFRLDKGNSHPKYVQDQTLSGLSIFAGEDDASQFRPVNVEFLVQAEQSARVRYSWRSQSDALVVELRASTGKLELRFLTEGGQPTFRTANALRFRGYLGSQVVSESRDYGNLRGSLGLFRYDHEFATGVLSYRPFTAKDRLGEIILLPEADRSDSVPPLVEGYDFLFEDSLASYIFAEHAIAVCQYGDKAPRQSGKAALNVQRTMACQDALPRGTAEFSVHANDAGKGDYPYPLFLYAERKLPELYIPLRKNVTITLPTERAFKFSADRSSSTWASAAPLTMSAGMMQKVELPARTKGRIHIDIGANEGPAVVVFERLLLPTGDSGLVDFSESADVVRLHSHVLLVKAWPLKLDLLAGSYEIRLLRGQDGAFCTLRADIVSRQEEKLRCPRALLEQDNDQQVGWIAADLATAVGKEFALYKSVLGVEWLSHAMATAAVQPPGPAATAPKDDAIASSLSESSSELGISVHAFLVADHAANTWKEQQAKRQRGVLDDQLVEKPGEKLERFVQVLREKSEGVFIEIGCPAGHLSFADYERIVTNLKPDGLRIYGCSVGVQQEELLGWVAQLMQHKNQRFLITAASSLGLLESDVHFPRLMLLGRKNSESYQARELVAALFRGAYTLSSGAALVIESATPAKKARGRTLAMTIDLRLLASARVWQLILYTEQGEIFRKPLYDTDARVQKIPLSVTIPKGAKWLRAEVRGASRQAVTRLLFERGDGMHLASTNFISIDSLMSSF